MNILIFVFGILFGGILQYAKLNKFNTISGLALRKDFAVAKAILMAIGVGAILINLEVEFGFVAYHIKPFVLGGIVWADLFLVPVWLFWDIVPEHLLYLPVKAL